MPIAICLFFVLMLTGGVVFIISSEVFVSALSNSNFKDILISLGTMPGRSSVTKLR